MGEVCESRHSLENGREDTGVELKPPFLDLQIAVRTADTITMSSGYKARKHTRKTLDAFVLFS